MMKIVVVGNCRSGSTRLAEALAYMHGVTYLDEIVRNSFANEVNVKNIQSIKSLDSFCVKIIPHFLSDALFDLVNWNNIDLIVQTVRHDTVSAFLSNEYANIEDKWIRRRGEDWPQNKFNATLEHIPNWLQRTSKVNVLVKKIQLITHTEIPTFTYEDISSNSILHQKIIDLRTSIVNPNFLVNSESNLCPTGLDYSQLCNNYVDVVARFEQLN
jgi:hypothetical protein